MADLARIKGNVTKMASMNAPEADIDGYIASEGVSLDDVRNFQSPVATMQALPNSGGTSNPNDPQFSGLPLPDRPVPTGTHLNEPSHNGPLDVANAFGNRFVSSIPIAGPTLQNMGENFDAALDNAIYRPLTGNPGTTTPQDVAGYNSTLARDNPEATQTGAIAGPVAAYLLASRIPGAAKLLGLEGSTLSRFGFGLPSTFAVNAGDELAHGKSIGDALLNSILPTAAAAPFMLFGGGKTTRPTEAPSVADLKQEAGTIYDQARASGVTMPQSGTIALSDNMYQVARDAGIVSPTGAIAKGYGKIGDVIDHLDQYSRGVMTVPQMQATRKLIQDAAGSIDKGERRVGTMMLKAFDKVVAQGVPQLGEAAPIYARAMRGETVENAINKAGTKAAQFTQSGPENALRTTFRSLDDKIVAGKLRGFSDSERAAIQDVSRGTKLGNLLRAGGKFAPTGVVPFLGSGGVGAITDMATGNHAMGAAAALATMLAGGASRAGANALQGRNAQIAAALVRRGAEAPLVNRTGLISSQVPNALARAIGSQLVAQ